jgi:hypothetical protein
VSVSLPRAHSGAPTSSRILEYGGIMAAEQTNMDEKLQPHVNDGNSSDHGLEEKQAAEHQRKVSVVDDAVHELVDKVGDRAGKIIRVR